MLRHPAQQLTGKFRQHNNVETRWVSRTGCLSLVALCSCCRCIQPYMPEHNSQQLLYAAMNTGQLALAEQQAQVAVDFPKQYGPTVMADGGCLGQYAFTHWLTPAVHAARFA